VKLRKAAVVTAATAGLMLAGSPAFAAPSVDVTGTDAGVTACDAGSDMGAEADQHITFADAFYTFIEGGGALGYGAASLIAGAYAGIATTPALIAQSFSG
jgi:hypothetical protein